MIMEYKIDNYEPLFKASNVEIGLDSKHQILICRWIGLQDEAPLKQTGEIIRNFLKEHKCSKILNDNIDVLGSWYHSTDWTAKIWFPSMIEAGLKHFAWVCSKDLFAQLSAKRALPPGNVARAFATFEEGYAWLLKLNDENGK